LGKTIVTVLVEERAPEADAVAPKVAEVRVDPTENPAGEETEVGAVAVVAVGTLPTVIPVKVRAGLGSAEVEMEPRSAPDKAPDAVKMVTPAQERLNTPEVGTAKELPSV